MLKTFKNAKLAFLAGGLFFIGLLAFSPRPADMTTNSTTEATVYDEYLGQVLLVGNNFCPRGFLECDGQLLAISSNTALFSLLGTTYGGDGRTTFGIPDLRDRAAIGVGLRPGANLEVRQGAKGGAVNVTPASTSDANPATTTGTLGMRYCICANGVFPARD